MKKLNPEVVATFIFLKAFEVFAILLGSMLLSRFGLWFDKVTNSFLWPGDVIEGFWTGLGVGVAAIFIIFIALAISLGVIFIIVLILWGILSSLFELNWKWANKIVKESNKKK